MSRWRFWWSKPSRAPTRPSRPSIGSTRIALAPQGVVSRVDLDAALEIYDTDAVLFGVAAHELAGRASSGQALALVRRIEAMDAARRLAEDHGLNGRRRLLLANAGEDAAGGAGAG